ncbi:MAG: helix-turn-helix domain-containing protein [Candidatus Nanopelagicales bacterium]
MQTSQGPEKPLLTALEVQELLHIDRSTVYRMAEDGRLPALRVGRSWRFPADLIQALATSGTDPAHVVASNAPTSPDARDAGPGAEPGIASPSPPPAHHRPMNEDAAGAAVEVASDLLGVMMVVTDMAGQPLTEVTNPSGWFAAHAAEPGGLDQCVAEWRDLADHPDLTPEFRTGALGFQCARAFIRHGSALVGMVLAGGVSPALDPEVDPDLYHLDDSDRQRVLAALPRIAAAISRASAPSRTAAQTPAPYSLPPNTPAPNPVATTKENR